MSETPEEQPEWELEYSKRAEKDRAWLEEDGTLWENALEIEAVLRVNPYERSQRWKALVGKLKGLFERRINIHFRVIYSVDKEAKVVRIVRMKKHT